MSRLRLSLMGRLAVTMGTITIAAVGRGAEVGGVLARCGGDVARQQRDHVGDFVGEHPVFAELQHRIARLGAEFLHRREHVDRESFERAVDAHVKNLRRKIEPDAASPRYVQTVHGVGYRLATNGGP